MTHNQDRKQKLVTALNEIEQGKSKPINVFEPVDMARLAEQIFMPYRQGGGFETNREVRGYGID